MTLDKLLVMAGGLSLIGFIYWFFFGKREEATLANDKIEIIVSGGYKPSVIKLKKDQTTSLFITRTDNNSCLEEIILPDFKIKEYLPLNEKVQITITPKEKGEFPFSCGMNMFHGKVIVV